MELIYPYVKDLGLTDDEIRVYSRTIHASGDVEYAKLVRTSPDAVKKGIEALKNGAHIYCDVEMVRTGINKPAANNSDSGRSTTENLDMAGTCNGQAGRVAAAGGSHKPPDKPDGRWLECLQ